MMDVVVIDIGGSNVKLYAPDRGEPVKVPSGDEMTAAQFVRQALKVMEPWKFDAVSIGFPGPVIDGRPASEPQNLSGGWTRFDFEKAFAKPVKIINDAAMQALGSYEGGRMLFIGLGTGLGSALILNDIVIPLELGELRYSRTDTLESVLGKSGLKDRGPLRWEKAVHGVVANLRRAFVVDYVVLGGGSAKKIKEIPDGARIGSNRMAARGGLRLWGGAPVTAKVPKGPLTIA